MLKMRTSIKCYSELIRLPTLEERFKYLQCRGEIGRDTFGFDRWMNQRFYQSAEWKNIRRQIIIRDMFDGDCCDLGVPDWPIPGQIYIHHMNPILPEDIAESTEFLLDPEYLICCSSQTHRAIHYGDVRLLPQEYIPRSMNDTCPWKH